MIYGNQKIIEIRVRDGYLREDNKKARKLLNGAAYKLYNIPQELLDEEMAESGNFSQAINNYKSFLPLFLLSFIITIFTIVSSFYFKIMLDNYNNKNYIILIFILFIIFNLIKTLTNYFRNKVTFILNEKIDLDITCNTYKNIINLPYNYYKNHTTGDVISRVTKLNDIRELINKVFISIFMDLPLSLVSFITLYIISSKLFYITILLLLLYILIILIYILPSKNIINKIRRNKK